MRKTKEEDDCISLIEVAALRSLRRNKKLHKALLTLCGRITAQVAQQFPSDLMLWLYLTGLAHGAEIEKRNRILDDAATTRL
jgi:hypothetical protein